VEKEIKMANSIKLDDRYSVLYGSQILLFDNQMKKAVPLDPEVAHRLTDLAKLGTELAGLGATMTSLLPPWQKKKSDPL
jgi:hypothetical protein